MLFSIRFMHVQLKREVRNYRVAFLNSFPLYKLILSSSLKLHYRILRTKTWALMTLLCCVLLMITHVLDQEVGKRRKKSVEVCPSLLGSSKAKITVLFDMISMITQSFRQTEPLTTTTAIKTSATGLTWVAGRRCKRIENKEENMGCPFIWYGKSSFPILEPELDHFSCNFPSPHVGAHFWDWSYWGSKRGNSLSVPCCFQL